LSNTNAMLNFKREYSLTGSVVAQYAINSVTY